MGQTTALTVYNSGTNRKQLTLYKYTDPYNASLVCETYYPDEVDAQNGTPISGAKYVGRTYNLDGSLATMTDQNDTVHTYGYNNRRQLNLDAVTTLGTGVDPGVEAIGRVYDTLGRLDQVISYDNSNATTVLNKIDYGYRAIQGTLYNSRQYHDGSSTNAAVSYGVTTDVDANGVFEDGLNVPYIKYPNDAYSYQTRGNSGNPFYFNNNIDGRLKRITHLRWRSAGGSAANIVAYKYNGTSRLVKTDYDIPNVRREMYGSTAGDYNAWDRFGRTKHQQWEEYNGTASTLDQVDYTYDYAGNRLTRDVLTSTNNTRDQKYGYDGLQRLLTVDVGTLSGTTLTSPSYKESYSLDALGNWINHDRSSDGGPGDFHQSRTHNAANEILTNGTDINDGGGWSNAGWVTPVHDGAGNMTTIPSPSDATQSLGLKYDAWNRLVEVTNSSNTPITRNEYDGLNRRIKKTVGGNSYDYYYNRQWQVLEVRKDGDPDPWKQYVYHPHYVDAIAMRRYDENTDGQNEEEHYYLQDANFNVTAVVDNMGDVEERYTYTPYGRVTFLDSSYAALSTQESDIDNDLLYTGRRRDPETGLQLNRNRFYASHLGRWVNRDPIGYLADDPNLYAYVGSQPTEYVDPLGLYKKCQTHIYVGHNSWATNNANQFAQLNNGKFSSCSHVGAIACGGGRGGASGPQDINYVLGQSGLQIVPGLPNLPSRVWYPKLRHLWQHRRNQQARVDRGGTGDGYRRPTLIPAEKWPAPITNNTPMKIFQQNSQQKFRLVMQAYLNATLQDGLSNTSNPKCPCPDWQVHFHFQGKADFTTQNVLEAMLGSNNSNGNHSYILTGVNFKFTLTGDGFRVGIAPGLPPAGTIKPPVWQWGQRY